MTNIHKSIRKLKCAKRTGCEWSFFGRLSSKITVKTSRAPKARARKMEGFFVYVIEKKYFIYPDWVL